MRLHDNSKQFSEIILNVSEMSKITVAVIEKDYYVSLILNEFAKSIPNILFKGGTSLSKCYGIIKRFSEDIDLTLTEEFLTQGNRVETKRKIVEICTEKLGFVITNIDNIRSKKMFNNYKVAYNNLFVGPVEPLVKIDTIFSIKSFPYETRTATNIIYETLKGKGYDDFLQNYGLVPFPIRTQTIERTFIDKIFALCDYYLGDFQDRTSRHLYDLYKLYPNVTFGEDFDCLVKETREARLNSPFAISANKSINIYNILSEIVSSDFYEKDYNTITKKLLDENISYEETKVNLCKIRDKVFSDSKPT